MRKAIILGILAGAMVTPATAVAASDATPGKVTTKITEKTTHLNRTYTHHQVTITQTRSGITGGRLWDFSQTMQWDTNSGWVWNTTITRSAHGSYTWNNDGLDGSDHWGCQSAWPSGPLCSYEGWAGTWHFSSVIHDPIFGTLHENNYPRITLTGWGSRKSNGHFYTYTRKCGC